MVNVRVDDNDRNMGRLKLEGRWRKGELVTGSKLDPSISTLMCSASINRDHGPVCDSRYSHKYIAIRSQR